MSKRTAHYLVSRINDVLLGLTATWATGLPCRAIAVQLVGRSGRLRGLILPTTIQRILPPTIHNIIISTTHMRVAKYTLDAPTHTLGMTHLTHMHNIQVPCAHKRHIRNSTITPSQVSTAQRISAAPGNTHLQLDMALSTCHGATFQRTAPTSRVRCVRVAAYHPGKASALAASAAAALLVSRWQGAGP